MPTTVNAEPTLISSSSVVPVTSRVPPMDKVDPSKVKFASSSSSPPAPTITILLSVKSSTTAEFAVIPPLTSSSPVVVVTPEAIILEIVN